MLSFKRYKCDCCGMINPPKVPGSKRLCAACMEPGGFYRKPGDALGANGKITRIWLQFPIRLVWQGWWRF